MRREHLPQASGCCRMSVSDGHTCQNLNASRMPEIKACMIPVVCRRPRGILRKRSSERPPWTVFPLSVVGALLFLVGFLEKVASLHGACMPP